MKSANNIDKSNMRQVILDFPKQFQGGVEAARKIDLSKYQNLRSPIVICGMGGSASVGDLLKVWLRHEYLGVSQFEVLIYRDYHFPKLERKEGVWEPLIVAISYSGNTEEALSAYEQAQKRQLPLVSMATGGKLKKFALRDGTPFIQIPKTGIQPRSSLGYQFGALVALLEKLGVFSHETNKVFELEHALMPERLEEAAKKIARTLADSIPLIYASAAWRELAHIVKIKFNEHAKTPAFWNYFPELNHNEMTGFATQNQKRKTKYQKFHVLILEDAGDHPRTKKRMRLTAKLLAKKGIRSTLIPIKGKTILQKIFTILLLGDWIAYYTAILRGVDPTPVTMVEESKRFL